MTVTATELRANVYRLLDQVLETGVPLQIGRNGKKLKIGAEEAPSKLSRLERRPDAIRGDPGDLVCIDWYHEWQP